MENNNGKGLFYGLVGVATLIVAIIGATYAYFSVTQQSSDLMYGQAATAGLNVNVVRMTQWSASEGIEVKPENAHSASYVMVPQLDTTLGQAIVGSTVTGSKPCIDAAGSLVCSIYRIIVQNTGSAPITVEGELDFYTSSKGTTNQTTMDESGKFTTKTDGADNAMNHLKWARLTQPSSVKDGEYTYAQVIKGGALDTIMPTTLMTYTNGTLAGAQQPGYQVTPDGIVYSYQNVANGVNTHFYAMNVSVASGKTDNDYIDLLNGHKVTGAHGRYTDLIDPTGDLTVSFTGSGTNKTATVSDNAQDANGKWYLKAKDNLGDTKVFYIVVWISENKERQNEHDFGQFTGTVTFRSSAGSGASSTFTENVGA